MVGFIKGFFGSNKQSKPEVEVSEPVSQPVKSEKPSGAYFLSSDEAQTLGNVDYMRTAKTIRRTFPSQNGEELELIQKVSAMGKVETKEEAGETPVVQSTTTAQPSFSITSETVAEAADRRRTDTNMDMFRDMARGMKKK